MRLGLRNGSESGERTCDVESDDGDCGVLDVGGDETFEPFLAGGVPEVEDDDLILHVHLLRHEVDSDRSLCLVSTSPPPTW